MNGRVNNGTAVIIDQSISFRSAGTPVPIRRNLARASMVLVWVQNPSTSLERVYVHSIQHT